MTQDDSFETPGNQGERAADLLKNVSIILNQDTDFMDKLQALIAKLGESFKLDRVYYFHLFQTNNTWFANQRAEWTALDVSQQIDNPELQGVDMTPMHEVIETLAEKQLFHGTVKDLASQELKEILESQEIQSVLFAPVFLKNQLTGFLGFDDCKLPRSWSQEESDMLSFSASLLSTILVADVANQENENLDQLLRVSEESAQRGTWRIDLKENTMQFEDNWLGLLGYSVQDVVESPVWFEQLMHPSDRNRVLNELDPFQSNTSKRLLSEYRIRAKNGTYRWFQTRAEINRDLHNWPIELRGISFDITARTTYKTSLKEAEREYRQLVETLQDIIFKLDHQGNLTYINQAWQDITEFNVPISVKKSLYSFIHPEDRANVQAEIESLSENRESVNLEFRLLHALVGFKWVRAMIRLSDLKSNEKSGTMVNVHAQKEVQLALQDSEERFRLMSDNMSELVCMHDTAGCLTYVSPSCKEMLGYEQSDMKGLDPGDIMSNEAKESITQTLLHPMIQGDLSNDTVQVQINTANGSSIWLETVVQPIFKNGELKSLLSVSRDISARKEVEEEMAKALTKEKELNTLRSTFITMASHEFRTPLSSIKSSVDLLEMYAEEVMPSMKSSFSRHVTKVRNQIDRLTDMMNDVLILGKTEAKKMPFEPVELDMVEFCMDFLEQHFLNRPDGRFVKVKVEGKRNEVKADPNLLGHIMSNVLSNAFKYSVDSPNPELTLRFKESHLLVEVQDFGVGIPKGEQNQLFESFFRASNTMTIQGTGLGLVIVKEFMELHRGSVNIESAENKGTLVVLRFPL